MQFWHSQRGLQAWMGSIRARQKGWRVARGSSKQQSVLVLRGECPWHRVGGALPLSASS